MKNYFGFNIPNLQEIANNETLRPKLASLFEIPMTEIGLSPDESDKFISSIFKTANNSRDQLSYEQKAKEYIVSMGIRQKVANQVNNRSEIVYRNIEPYLPGDGKVLDFGCGDGKVGALAGNAKDLQVDLFDVYKNENIDSLALPYSLGQEGKKIPFADEVFDLTLVLMVLHHSADPKFALREASRVTKRNGRIIVIESVFGIKEQLSEGLRYPTDADLFFRLQSQEQLANNVFFDHFFNRILFASRDSKSSVNMPFNFNTPEGWRDLFEKEGLRQLKLEHLGIDLKIVPEYHTLHLLLRAN